MNFDTLWGYIGTTVVSGIITVVIMWSTQKRQGDRLVRLESVDIGHAHQIRTLELIVSEIKTSVKVLSETSDIKWAQVEKDLDAIKLTLESQFTQLLTAIRITHESRGK